MTVTATQAETPTATETPAAALAVEPALANLALAFPGQAIHVAVPDIAPNITSSQSFNTLRLLTYAPAAPSTTNWVLTAANFFTLLEAAGLTLTADIVLASIGPITSQTLRDLGHPPTVEAIKATPEAMAEALSAHWR